jgi:hypothetical protein
LTCTVEWPNLELTHTHALTDTDTLNTTTQTDTALVEAFSLSLIYSDTQVIHSSVPSAATSECCNCCVATAQTTLAFKEVCDSC